MFGLGIRRLKKHSIKDGTKQTGHAMVNKAPATWHNETIAAHAGLSSWCTTCGQYLAEGNNHMTVAIIMHILREGTRRAQQPPRTSALSGHALISRAPAKLAQQTIAAHVELSSWMRTCGLYLLLYGFLMIGVRSGAPDTSSGLHLRAFGEKTSRDSVHNICSVFRRDRARIL